jgi:hypothetical protein
MIGPPAMRSWSLGKLPTGDEAPTAALGPEMVRIDRARRRAATVPRTPPSPPENPHDQECDARGESNQPHVSSLIGSMEPSE